MKVENFKKLFPNCKDSEGWVSALNEVLPQYEINTKQRVAAFIAQCGHESGGWTVFSENLNYKAASLDKVFPKYFKNAGRDAKQYEKQPEKIANVIYANRMGNGDTASGDGYKYRGRGPIQLTGKSNYQAFAKSMNVDISDPDIVRLDKRVSLMSAIWFWNSHNLNNYADKGDIKGMTKVINGGYIGLEDRIKHYEEALKVLDDTQTVTVDTPVHEEAVSTPKVDISSLGVIRVGDRGENVKVIQKAFGIKEDGIYGKQTAEFVKRWQGEHGLVQDGILGPKSLAVLLG